MKKEALAKNLSWLIVILIGLILCVRELREPDMWWQLRTGEWMIENQQITYQDVFSFTHEDEPWINVKWLYEVIAASFSNVVGPESVMYLQMISIILILFFLRKTMNLFFYNKNELLLGIVGAALVLLFVHAQRLNGRPEMTTYTLTAIYFYLFTLFRKKQSKLILLLIPLQLFWTNMHEAYGVGVVMIAIFVVGNWIEYFLSFKSLIRSNQVNLMLPTVIGIISISSIVINPNGLTMLSHYLEIYSQLKDNQFTTENFSFTDSLYWDYGSITNFILFLLTSYYLFIVNRNGGITKRVLSLIEEYGVVYILLFCAFFYLSLLANRNTYFFVCISFPIYGMIINKFLKTRIKNVNKSYVLLVIIGVLFYISVGSGVFYKKFIDREKYGLRISPTKNVIGIANFMKENNIEGNGFTDYLSSSFLLWYLQPEFKTYLDLRDLDIFEQKFMTNVFRAYFYPDSPLKGGEHYLIIRMI